MSLESFWIIFSLSFLVALTGAMSPGPLFTYTIIKTIKTPRHGYLTGFWIILGHALLEMGIIIVLLFGFATILSQPTMIKIIGIMGCGLLCFFGITVLKDLMQNKISTEFLRESKTDEFSTINNSSESKVIEKTGPKFIENPVLGGILISMSNPYWWFWWAAIGFAFMIQYNITFTNWNELIAFFLGHEMGDLAWYLFVSIFTFLGRRALNHKIYYSILAICSVFMIGFGIYLGISPFLSF